MTQVIDWRKTCEAFRRIVAKRGVSKVANEVPVNRATLYRFIRGDTESPSRAVRAGIERIVQQSQEPNP